MRVRRRTTLLVDNSIQFYANEIEVGLEDLNQAAFDLTSLELAKIKIPLVNSFSELVNIMLIQLLDIWACWLLEIRYRHVAFSMWYFLPERYLYSNRVITQKMVGVWMQTPDSWVWLTWITILDLTQTQECSIMEASQNSVSAISCVLRERLIPGSVGSGNIPPITGQANEVPSRVSVPSPAVV